MDRVEMIIKRGLLSKEDYLERYKDVLESFMLHVLPLERVFVARDRDIEETLADNISITISERVSEFIVNGCEISGASREELWDNMVSSSVPVSYIGPWQIGTRVWFINNCKLHTGTVEVIRADIRVNADIVYEVREDRAGMKLEARKLFPSLEAVEQYVKGGYLGNN